MLQCLVLSIILCTAYVNYANASPQISVDTFQSSEKMTDSSLDSMKQYHAPFAVRKIMLRYTQALSLATARNVEKPEASSEKGLEGTVYMRVQMLRNGQIKEMRIEKSSGHKVLDDAALKAVKKSNPLPPVPEGYDPLTEKFAFIVPVTFK